MLLSNEKSLIIYQRLFNSSGKTWIEVWANSVNHVKICAKCHREGCCLKGIKLDCDYHKGFENEPENNDCECALPENKPECIPPKPPCCK